MQKMNQAVQQAQQPFGSQGFQASGSQNQQNLHSHDQQNQIQL